MVSISTERTPAKTPGEEFLPGYKLIHPLGAGGFGEVWKCEAPGGLQKAVKFVAGADGPGGGNASLRKELEAFERIKAIRHPFILVVERVELVGSELVMVMELAEQSLFDRYQECARDDRRGVPRDELLVYLTDVAEALDVIGSRHGLQHLDVKPANLFVVGGHAKLGDFGLVREVVARGRRGVGFTPRYAAPEVTRGEVDPRSDQYSLALVYQEMLTGTFPFSARTASELMALHAGGQPDLTGLPAGDRPAVARALEKAPRDRYPTCLGFVRALLGDTQGLDENPTRSSLLRYVVRRAPDGPPPEARAADPPTTDFILLTPVPVEYSTGGELSKAFPGFRLIEEVEAGPRGRVVRAADPTGRLHLVRLVRTDSPAAVGAGEGVLRMVGAMARVCRFQAVSGLHPRVVGFARRDDLVTLRELHRHQVRQGRPGVPKRELAEIVLKAARGLDAHTAATGAAHLLIDPGLVVIDGDEVGVVDYGVGEVLRRTCPDDAWVGDDPAPELRTGDPGPWTDQYQLAAAYLEAAGAWAPTPRRRSRPASPLAELTHPDLLTEGELAVLRTALSPDPKARYESCARFAEALHRAVVAANYVTVLPRIPVVCPAAWLAGGQAGGGRTRPTPAGFIESLLLAACRGTALPDLAVPPVLKTTAGWTCRFRVGHAPAAVEAGIGEVAGRAGAEWTRLGRRTYTLAKPLGRGVWGKLTGKRTRAELTLQLPGGGGGEAVLHGVLDGPNQPEEWEEDAVVLLVQELRDRLRDDGDRRRAFRVPTDLPVRLYPTSDEGGVSAPVDGRCQDLSAGGCRASLGAKVRPGYAFAEFPGHAPTAGFAILTQVLRTEPGSAGRTVVACQFFTSE